MKKLLIVALLLSSAQLSFCGGGIGKKVKETLSKNGEAQNLFLLGMQDKLKHMSKEQRKQNIESFMRIMQLIRVDPNQLGGNTRVPVFNSATRA